MSSEVEAKNYIELEVQYFAGKFHWIKGYLTVRFKLV